MNRRRMMMAQQNNGYELVYDVSSGTLPTDKNAWTLHKISGTYAIAIREGYLKLFIYSASDEVGFIPTERPIGQTKNSSISTTLTIGQNNSSSLTLVLTNGDKAAMCEFYYNRPATAETVWYIRAHNGNKLVEVAEKQVDLVKQTANLELVLKGNDYTFLINGEAIYTAPAISYEQLESTYPKHSYNLIADTSKTTHFWYYKDLTYKEW